MKINIDALLNTAIALVVLGLIIIGASTLLDYPAAKTGLLFCFLYITYDLYNDYADDTGDGEENK